MSARATCSCGWTGAYGSTARASAMAAKHVCRTNDGVRRTTRRHRCARCGLESVYENAGATEARYWFGKHSCRRREEALLRTALAQEKRDLVDRTPKPCLHKVARHQHGTPACYVLDRCRCIPCMEANTAREGERNRLKAYGRYNRYVPAIAVREHVRSLMEAGVGLKTIAKRSGVSTGTLSKLIYGVYESSGRAGHPSQRGKGKLIRPPSRRVLRETAEKLYAVGSDWTGGPAPLAPGAKDPAGTPLARQRLQSLVALGWSMSEIGRRLGVKYAGNACVMIHGGRGHLVMQRRTVDAANALFEQLSMTLPPETNQRERISVSRARRYAREHAWLPPLELEDLVDRDEISFEISFEISDEDLADVDEVAIQRRMNGDKAVRLNGAERVELVHRWRRSGQPMNECYRVTGLKPERYYADAEVPTDTDQQEAS